jgi:hypothetical protein
VAVRTEKGWEKRPLGAVAPVMRQQAIDAAFDRQPMEGEEVDQCAAILTVMRDNQEKLANDVTGVRAILEQVKTLLSQTQTDVAPDAAAVAIEPPTAAAAPSRMPADAKAAAREHADTSLGLECPESGDARPKDDEDAVFEELYPSPAKPVVPPKPLRKLKPLTQAHVLAALRVHGLDKEGGSYEVEKALAVKVLRVCATNARPWDEGSKKAAFKKAEEAFWALGRPQGAGRPQLSDAGLRRAASISVWGQNWAAEGRM